MCYQTLWKICNIKLYENPPRGIRVLECTEINGADKQRYRHGGTKRCTVVMLLFVCKTTLYFAWFQASAAKWMRTALFWAITQRVVLSPYRHFGSIYQSQLQGSRVLGSLNLEDGTDRLSQNVGNELPLPATCVIAQFSHLQGGSHTSLSGHCFWHDSPQWEKASSFTRFVDHTKRHTTVGRTRLDEWSARRRDLYLTIHNTHDIRSCPWQDSNPQPQHARGRKPTS
jgi:hypothetical protein